MIGQGQYLLAQATVKAYEQKLGIYNVRGSLPFSEYHEFHKWIEDEGWYEAADFEYDNSNNPNTCIRLNIKELYLEYLENSNDK
jgi:hypothetical protein